MRWYGVHTLLIMVKRDLDLKKTVVTNPVKHTRSITSSNPQEKFVKSEPGKITKENKWVQ